MAAFISWDPQSLGQLSRRKLSALRNYGLPTAQEIQRISEQITPQENLLTLRQLQQFAPQLTTLGTQLAGQSQRGGIENDIAAILGSGQNLVGNALQLDMLVNPQFYNMRQLAGSGIEQLLGAQSPSRLSGAELAETERGLNRYNASRGNVNVTDATTTAAAAGAFGNKLAEKQARFAQSLSLIPSLSGISRAPIDTFGIATGRGNQYNPLGVQNVSTGSQSGNQFQSQLGDLQSQYIQSKSNAKSVSDTLEGAVGSCLSCYIMREYLGLTLPWYLKAVRDFEYKRNPSIQIGYRNMSYWLIPLLRKLPILRWLISWIMIKPLLYHAAYRTGYNKWGRILLPFKWFWLKIWSIKLCKYGCTGWNLGGIGRWQAELWFCPPRSIIPIHSHSNLDSHIIHIWGTALIVRGFKERLIPPFTLFKRFLIKAGERHGFQGYQNWFIFLNIERWHNNTNKTSASINLKEEK